MRNSYINIRSKIEGLSPSWIVRMRRITDQQSKYNSLDTAHILFSASKTRRFSRQTHWGPAAAAGRFAPVVLGDGSGAAALAVAPCPRRRFWPAPRPRPRPPPHAAAGGATGDTPTSSSLLLLSLASSGSLSSSVSCSGPRSSSNSQMIARGASLLPPARRSALRARPALTPRTVAAACAELGEAIDAGRAELALVTTRDTYMLRCTGSGHAILQR